MNLNDSEGYRESDGLKISRTKTEYSEFEKRSWLMMTLVVMGIRSEVRPGGLTNRVLTGSSTRGFN